MSLITIRLKDKTLKGKLAKLAKADKRTLSNYLETILAEYLKRNGAK